MNKRGLAISVAFLLFVPAPPTFANTNLVAVEQQQVFTKKYSNCSTLNKDFPGGVAKSSKVKNQGGRTKYQPKVDAKIYEANKGKDRDKDGIACER